MPPALPQPDLNQLRTWRNRPDRDLGLTSVLGAASKDLKRRARSIGALGTAWQKTIPPHLADHCTIVSFLRGALLVRCDDASTRFELDRFLRCGGELALIRAAPAGLSKVRLVL